MADHKPLREGWKFTWAFLINEVAARIFIIIAAVIIFFKINIFQRSTQAKDWPDYAYPFTTNERFPSGLAIGVLLGITLLYLAAGCLLLRFGGRWTPTMVYEELLLWVLGFTLSTLFTYLAMDLTKRMYGRLRPDYLSRCYGSNDINVWMNQLGYKSWDDLPEIPDCTGWSKISPSLLKDGRQSFPSGHSAFSFEIMTWTALWAYSKLTRFPDWGAWRLVIPSAPIAVALAIAVSRTMDYRHHPTDVIAGGLLGTIIASLCFNFYFPLRMKPIAETLYAHYQRVNSQEGAELPRVNTADLAYLRRATEYDNQRPCSWENSGDQA